jgi:glycerol-3-phosphate O-acyltransferase/dihydroxyacetone phosphate acyltransferase
MMFELNSYSGIIVVEAGIVDWKDLRPFFMRLLPSTRKRLAAMPAIRKSLQEDLRGKCINMCMRVRVMKN